MFHRLFKLFLGSIVVLLVAGCVKSGVTKAPARPINKVAIASFAVANWRNSVTGSEGAEKAAQLINSTLTGLIDLTEARLAGVMHVTRVGSFVRNPSYHNLGVKSDLMILVPKVNGVAMPVFTNDQNEMIAATIKPEIARKLCASLKVDAVLVVYSEWALQQGMMVPTRKALAKDVITIWDRDGNLVFQKRVDSMGDRNVGVAFGPTKTNPETIKEWSIAYMKGFDAMLPEIKKLK